MSERTTLILDGGGGGPRHKPGDYLYFSGSATRLNQGAWGLIRVLPGQSDSLQPLPDNSAPAGTWTPPSGTSPPPTTDPGNPCPAGAPTHSFAVSAVDVPDSKTTKVTAAYVRTADVASIQGGTKKVEPLVLHVAAGECVQVDFRNDRMANPLVPTSPKASFSVAKLDRNPESSGVNVGYTSEQNVAPGSHGVTSTSLIRRSWAAQQSPTSVLTRPRPACLVRSWSPRAGQPSATRRAA